MVRERGEKGTYGSRGSRSRRCLGLQEALLRIEAVELLEGVLRYQSLW